MTPYFNTPERVAALKRVALEWVGTPFHPHAALPGVGVDCVHLLGEILVQAGFVQTYTFPGYAMDGSHHLDHSQVRAFLDAHGRLADVDHYREDLAAGDIVAFDLGRVAHHVGLVVDPPLFIHAMRGYGAILSRLDDPTFGKRIEHVYRPMR